MKFVEIQPDKFVHSDQIVSVELVVSEWNAQKKPFKYIILTTLLDGQEIESSSDHKINIEPQFNTLIAQLNS